jgi:flagellar biogenesis protein FliO
MLALLDTFADAEIAFAAIWILAFVLFLGWLFVKAARS